VGIFQVVEVPDSLESNFHLLGKSLDIPRLGDDQSRNNLPPTKVEHLNYQNKHRKKSYFNFHLHSFLS
jgi:hypothetical protein